MAAMVLGNSGEQRRIYTLCMASDHSAYNYALASIESATKPGARGPPPNSAKSTVTRNHPYFYRSEEPCRHFNRGNCNMVACKFEHCCSACPARGPHPAISCPTKASTRPRQQVPWFHHCHQPQTRPNPQNSCLMIQDHCIRTI